MNKIILFVVVILFAVVIYSLSNGVEGFATSPGTLLQLSAKGAQDTYLTGFPSYPYEWRNWRDPPPPFFSPYLKHKPYYFYNRYPHHPPLPPPTWVGGRPIYGRPSYYTPSYYTPLGQYWR